MATGIASAAVLIAAITVLARVVGFGRQVVFVRSVGVTCLNTAYTTANAIPNLVFEMVIGGALAAVVVPVLASAAQRGDRLQVRASASALLTWSVLVLAPITLLIVALAGPLTALLLGDAGACADSYEQVADTSAQMLRIFAPQMLFYGLAVVLYGLLQAHRRFAAPALAPLVSSLVVIAAYLAYAVDAGESRGSIEALTTRQLALLAGGTTLGVMALALVPAVAAGRLRLRLRPALAFPDGVLPRVRALAAAAIGLVVAQQVATAVAIRLANDRGSEGAVGRVRARLDGLPAAVVDPGRPAGDERLPAARRPPRRGGPRRLVRPDRRGEPRASSCCRRWPRPCWPRPRNRWRGCWRSGPPARRRPRRSPARWWRSPRG